MPLDSLGLGLTLDTTLLEKADKTLENMHKNSKLIMQNLTRGFTSFNSGGADALTKMSTALGHVSDALTKIDNAKVSPDFDTKGQEKYINRMQQLLDIVEKMSKIRGAKFYDPTEVYATDKDASDILAEIEELKEYKDELKELIDTVNNYGDVQSKLSKKAREQKEAISKQEEEVKKLAKTYKEAEAKFNSSMEALSKFRDEFFDSKRKKKPSLTDEEIQEMYSSSKSKTKSALLKQLEDERVAINEAMKSLDNAYKDLAKKREALSKTTTEYKENRDAKNNIERIKIEYNNLREREKILRAELKFAQATQAERAAMLTKKNEAEIKADQKRIRDVQKSYEQLRKEIQKGEKDIADLKKSREKLKAAGGKTKEIDDEIAALKKAQDERLDAEIEFRTSKYWPQLEEIDKKYSTKAFKEEQKRKAKEAEKASRKDVTAALQYSRNAQTINEEKEAIKRLVEARDNLSTSTARYKKTVEDINKRILAHKDHIEAVTRVEKEQNTLADSVINRYRKQLKALDEVNEALKKQMKIEHKTSVADLDKSNADTKVLLARQQTIADDIVAIEKQAQGELKVIREQHDAERAKKRIDETLRQNEREKQEYAKLLDDLYALEKQKKAMKDAGAKKGDKAYDNILQQEQDLNNQISQLKAKHQNDLDEIRKKHDKKRNDDEVKAFIDAQKEKIKEAEKAQQKINAYNEKYGTISKVDAEAAIVSAKDAQNIAQHKKAIEDLQRVKAKLDNTDEDYFVTLKKVDKALKEHHKALRDAGVESNNLMQTHRGLMNIGGQLARRLALAFSVSQLSQYFRKLVEVRGQFEKTEVALTSIIGDNQKAQKLMNQTIALAIQSPFTLQQLTGYTKQLAAYQVSYEELHETTKMLADVSAGLGVEMDRLILAFGQVKAANYLRATEVRQFTEAGFNILGELAKYYTELEGKMITVGDVQERVTKRMVDFGDVEEIFHRVTSAGGMFFDMQSKQAETLAGQWTNLQDRIDVMLNEIGSDKDGLLKGLVRMLVSLIDNWDALADVIKIVVGAFALYKLNLLAVTKAQIANSIAARALIKDEIRMLGVTKGLSSAWNALGFSANFANGAMKKFLVANVWLLALAAIVSVIASLVSHFNKLNNAIDENSRAFSENRSEAKKLVEEYNRLNSVLAETTDKEKQAAIIEEKRLKLQELSVKLKERGLKLTNEEGAEVDPQKVGEGSLDELFNLNKETLDKAYTLGEELGEAIANGVNAAQGTVLGFSFLGENLAEDAEDLGETYGKIASHTFDNYMKGVEANIHNNFDKLSTLSQKQYKELAEGRKAERDEEGKVTKWLESEYDWTKRRLNLLQEIAFRENKILGVQLKLNNARANLTNAEYEFSLELDGVLNKLIEKYGSIEALKEEYKKNPQVISAAIKTEVDKTSWNENVKWFAEQDLHAKLTIDYNYVEVVSTTPPPKVYEGFKKDLIDARKNLEGKGEGYSNFFISTEDIDKMKFFSDGIEGIQKLYDENKKTIEQLDGTSDEYSKAEKTRLEAVQAELKETAKRWNYDLDKDTGGKGRDERLEHLKSQISLIKEMNQEYEKLNKTFSKAESLEKVKKAYADTAKELGLDTSTMDFTDEGTIESLEALLGKPEYAANKYVIELQKALDNFKVELGVEVKQEKDNDLKAQVQKLFDQYDLSLELKKLNIPPDLAKSLFGVDYLDLDDLNKAVQDKKAKFIGTDMEKEYKDFLDKISDLQRKQREDEAKEFINFLKNNLNEIQVIQDKGAYNIALADRLFAKGRITTEQYMSSIRQIVEDTNKEVAKVNLDKFKDSATYIKAMGNLAAYSRDELEGMISALQGQVGANAGNMGADEIHAYYEALERLVDQYDKIESPFQKGEINDLIEYLDLQKELNKEKEKEAVLEQRKAEINNRLNLLQAQLKSQQERGDVLGAASTQRQIKSAVGELKEVDGELVSVTSNISVISEKVANLGDGMIKSLVVAQKVVNEIANIANASTKMFDDIKSAADALGADTESGGWAKAGYAMEMVGGVSSELTQGLANFASGNFAGALANVVGMVTKLVSGFAKIHDQNYQDIIEAQAKQVERLGKAYEKLELASEEAYSIEQLKKVNEELKKNVELQMQSLKAMIAAENAKKNTDTEQIEAWNEELEALTQQWEELKQSLVEGVGGVADYRSQTREFVDSWVSAFKETGNGLKGLKDNFREFFDNIIAEQASLKVTEKFLSPFYESLNSALEDLELSVGESKALREEADKIMPQLSDALELIWNQLGGSSGATGDGLSGLQKGISGMSEQQAEILTAYWNSVRGYTASIDSKMDLILANMGVGAENNPMLEQLISQTSWLSKIHNILDGLTTSSSGVVGRRIKVTM